MLILVYNFSILEITRKVLTARTRCGTTRVYVSVWLGIRPFAVVFEKTVKLMTH